MYRVGSPNGFNAHLHFIIILQKNDNLFSLYLILIGENLKEYTTTGSLVLIMKRSTWLHLRLPFSFFLLPVYLFALAASPTHLVYAAWSMFVILHFFLYPASNAFNSYFDKDKQSIGVLENPPPVSEQLYWVALALDLVAVLWGLAIRWETGLMLLVYGLVSKAYSHPSVRLKKYPLTGWFVAGIFQGAFTFLTLVFTVTGATLKELQTPGIIIPAILCTLLLWGSYPMTQIYQHQEDATRGDLTLSRLLGIRGTFLFTAGVFLAADLGFIYYFVKFQNATLAWAFQLALIPVFGYFIWWLAAVWRREDQANYRNTMRLNMVSALCLNTFFGLWILINQ